MSTPAETVQEFVAAFIAAWPEGDTTTLGSFFSEDAVYHNMPMEPVEGRSAIQTALAEFMSMGGQAGVDIIHLVADGAIVMTERVDYFVGTEQTISMPVMGVFEVHGGVITAWRDYFDLAQVTSQMPGEG
ncbi:MAG TPA: limonene-1,2-epoxide hydrolase family protein [Acidimicrobiales bacterium]|jgi:limonene-1,2-epoxide hydrolase|nr:limonene-1,2-epoxide hydrolase family protein [Acidimicrobiales bacterium]